jgi:hypothetical protein
MRAYRLVGRNHEVCTAGALDEDVLGMLGDINPTVQLNMPFKEKTHSRRTTTTLLFCRASRSFTGNGKKAQGVNIIRPHAADRHAANRKDGLAMLSVGG